MTRVKPDLSPRLPGFATNFHTKMYTAFGSKEQERRKAGRRTTVAGQGKQCTCGKTVNGVGDQEIKISVVNE